MGETKKEIYRLGDRGAREKQERERKRERKRRKKE